MQTTATILAAIAAERAYQECKGFDAEFAYFAAAKTYQAELARLTAKELELAEPMS